MLLRLKLGTKKSTLEKQLEYISRLADSINEATLLSSYDKEDAIKTIQSRNVSTARTELNRVNNFSEVLDEEGETFDKVIHIIKINMKDTKMLSMPEFFKTSDVMNEALNIANVAELFHHTYNGASYLFSEVVSEQLRDVFYYAINNFMPSVDSNVVQMYTWNGKEENLIKREVKEQYKTKLTII